MCTYILCVYIIMYVARMGNPKAALKLIINKLQNVDKVGLTVCFSGCEPSYVLLIHLCVWTELGVFALIGKIAGGQGFIQDFCLGGEADGKRGGVAGLWTKADLIFY